MNKRDEHRDDDQLLRLADGELDEKPAAEAQAHLKACWQCRTRLEELQSTIAGYMRYRESVMEPLLPPPPQPWGSLRGRLRGIDAEMAPRRRWGRLFGRPQWLATAAAAVLIAAIAYRMGHEPVVNAAELLRKASAAEAAAAPPARRRIRIRTRTRTLVRAAAARAEDRAPELQALFSAANFSWDDPLSARSFAAWRGGLPDAADEVRSHDRLYEIRTRSRASTLTEAQLTLRAVDLRPLREVLQFEAGEQVEISEEPDAPAESMAGSRPAAAGDTVVARHADVASPGGAGAGEELRVIAALHQIGADLGEPIDVTRTEGEIQVAGTGLTASRQEQIRALLGGLPGVRLRFEEPQQPVAGAGQEHRAESRAQAAPVSLLQLQLQSYLGGAAALQKFTDGILDASEGAMARAHALRNLAERFPPAEERKIAAADREALAGLRRDHERALRAATGQMIQLLQPVAPVPEAPASGNPRGAVWQENTRRVLESAQQVDSLLNEMLAGGDSDAAGKHTPHELASALAELRARVANP